MDEEGTEVCRDVVSDGLPGLVCEGITLVPVGTGVERGVISLVDENAGSEVDQLSNTKAIHDPTHGPRGVGECWCK